mmetsp:Transcript_6204/g.12196  ORF Transcript_6204/g.12196 Transcript_6204/m.12196 type:complete len:98 (-) Transcript_6204:2126-2419(-)
MNQLRGRLIDIFERKFVWESQVKYLNRQVFSVTREIEPVFDSIRPTYESNTLNLDTGNLIKTIDGRLYKRGSQHCLTNLKAKFKNTQVMRTPGSVWK